MLQMCWALRFVPDSAYDVIVDIVHRSDAITAYQSAQVNNKKRQRFWFDIREWKIETEWEKEEKKSKTKWAEDKLTCLWCIRFVIWKSKSVENKITKSAALTDKKVTNQTVTCQFQYSI